VKSFPTDPLRQNNRLVAAFCDDLFDMVVNGTRGTPNADRVAEIARQINKTTDEENGQPWGEDR
jgi:hypothetical protein